MKYVGELKQKFVHIFQLGLKSDDGHVGLELVI
jgi:hypothetical protein